MFIDYLKLDVTNTRCYYGIRDLGLLGKVVRLYGNWYLYVNKESYGLSVDLIGAICKRIDFAVDVDFDGVIFEYMNEIADTIVMGRDGGMTYYIGSRRSPRFYRVYDRGVVIGLGARKIIRFELECKREVAKACWESFVAMVQGGVFFSEAVELVGKMADTRGLLPGGVGGLEVKYKKRRYYNWDRIFNLICTDDEIAESFLLYIKRLKDD